MNKVTVKDFINKTLIEICELFDLQKRIVLEKNIEKNKTKK